MICPTSQAPWAHAYWVPSARVTNPARFVSTTASYIEILFRHRNAVSLVEIQFPARLVNEALSVDLATKQVTRQLVDLGMLKPLR